jgi:hypothetical protein
MDSENTKIIGNLTATQDYWVTWDDAKAQVRRAIAAAGLKPTFFIPRSTSGGMLIMPLATGGKVFAERKAGSPIIFKAE